MSKLQYDVNGCMLRGFPASGLAWEIGFDWPIAQVLEFSDFLVVRIEPRPSVRLNENVYGISSEGKIVWQVKPRKYVYDDSPYTGMIKEGETVLLRNWDGRDVIVSPNNGNEIHSDYGR